MELLKIESTMTKIEKKRVWAANGKRRNIMEEWESWEYLILDDLKNGKSIDSKIQACIVGMGKYGLGMEKAKKYIQEQLKRLEENHETTEYSNDRIKRIP